MKRLIFMLTLVLAESAMAAEYNWEAKPDGENKMSLRLWVPDSGAPVAHLVFHLPGNNGDSRNFINEPAWRDFAARENCALLGIQAMGGKGGNYYEPRRWSGTVLKNGLFNLAEQSKRPELVQVKFLIWGHSAGGQFAYNFACWRPSLVQAFVFIKGAYYAEKTDEESRKIPGLCIAGSDDSDERLQNITSLFAQNRGKGAPWILAIEPHSGHEMGKSGILAMAFFEALLKNADNPDPAKTAWIGSLVDHQIRPYDPEKDKIPSPLTVQLPDKVSAEVWQSFVNGTLSQPATP